MLSKNEIFKHALTARQVAEQILSIRAPFADTKSMMGGCAIASCILHSMLVNKGKCKIGITKYHAFNLIDEFVVDVTASQFQNFPQEKIDESGIAIFRPQDLNSFNGTLNNPFSGFLKHDVYGDFNNSNMLCALFDTVYEAVRHQRQNMWVDEQIGLTLTEAQNEIEKENVKKSANYWGGDCWNEFCNSVTKRGV